jgi:flagellar biosynthesis/type III secretory pathway protein FliH
MAVAQKDEIIKLAYGELKVLSADKSKKMLYEARLKQQRDIWSFEDAARQEGMQQGIQQGIQQGMQKGMQQGLQKGLQNIIALLEQGVPLSEAKKKLGLE